MLIKREDYKAIKHMDRKQMSTYLQRVYGRGFEAGAKSAKELVESAARAAVSGTLPSGEVETK